MGLETKRAIKNAEDGWIVARRAEVKDICGGEIPVEYDWAGFGDDTKSVEWLEHNGPQQVCMALRTICRDDMGKEAVRSAVKKIVFRCAPSAAGKSVKFEGGVLEVIGKYSEAAAGTVRDKAIAECLMKAL